MPPTFALIGKELAESPNNAGTLNKSINDGVADIHGLRVLFAAQIVKFVFEQLEFNRHFMP